MFESKLGLGLGALGLSGASILGGMRLASIHMDALRKADELPEGISKTEYILAHKDFWKEEWGDIEYAAVAFDLQLLAIPLLVAAVGTLGSYGLDVLFGRGKKR